MLVIYKLLLDIVFYSLECCLFVGWGYLKPADDAMLTIFYLTMKPD